MADKPSNSRKRVNFQPARDGQAARWQIEERKSEKASAREEASPARKPNNQKERAQARAAEKRKERASRPLPEDSTVTTRERKRSPREEQSKAKQRPAERSGRRAGSPAASAHARAKTPAKADAQSRVKAAARARSQARVKVEAAPKKAPAEKRERQERAPQAKRAERIIAENPQRARRSTSDRTRGQVMEAMMPQKSKRGGITLSLSRNTLIIAALLAIVVVFFLWHPWSQGANVVIDGNDDAPAPSDILEERFATMPSYGTIAPVDFNAVEEEGFTAGFVLAHGGVVTDYSIYDTEPELSDESAEALNKALEPFAKNDIITAFLLMDIQTGRGFARNVDKKLYGASSFKGPYCAYLLKQYVDGGDVEITDSFASGYMTESLGYARYGSDTLKNLIQETIVESSNDAFASLRVNFSDATLANWLTEVNVDSQLAYDTWFPFNTVRNMAKLWMEAYYFLQTDTDAAKTLRGFLGETTKSFMREALTGVKVIDEKELVEEAGVIDVDAAEDEDAADDSAAKATELIESTKLQATGSLGENLDSMVNHSIDVLMAPEISVIDKAGWNIDADENYDALVDCGIVTCNGRDYLLCVMCDAAYTQSNVDKFEQLIAAIFEARRDLA